MHYVVNHFYVKKKNLGDNKLSANGKEIMETAIKVMISYTKDPVICGCGCGILAKMPKECMCIYLSRFYIITLQKKH